jgi:hypothetical protein
LRGWDREDCGSRPALTKKFVRLHHKGKKPGILAYASHPSYSRKHKIGISQSRLAWAKISTLFPKKQKMYWRCDSSTRVTAYQVWSPSSIPPLPSREREREREKEHLWNSQVFSEKRYHRTSEETGNIGQK